MLKAASSAKGDQPRARTWAERKKKTEEPSATWRLGASSLLGGAALIWNLTAKQARSYAEGNEFKSFWQPHAAACGLVYLFGLILATR